MARDAVREQAMPGGMPGYENGMIAQHRRLRVEREVAREVDESKGVA